MTALDSFIQRGLGAMDTLSGETFRLREVDRTANVGELTSERDLDGHGGYRLPRQCAIVYDLSRGQISPVVKVGETVWARGIKLKVQRALLDATTLTLECVDFTA